jgi:endonuclease/exonuclease/phosphatase family metal-dependent hydrolase
MKLKSFYESTPKHQEQRGVQVLELGDESGPRMLFLCTHLDFRPPDDERMASAKTINELVEKHDGEPALVAGDFNATPKSRPIREFEKEWTIAGGAKPQANGGAGGKVAAPILTFPSDKPDRRIDYVMYRPADKWEVVEVRVLDEPIASDHRPVLTVLRRK